MKPDKFLIYLLLILFLFVGCQDEPDKYTLKVEVEDEDTEWNLTLLGPDQDMTPTLEMGTMVLDLPPSMGAQVTLNPFDSNECFTFKIINENTGASQSMRGCGPLVKISAKPNKNKKIRMMHIQKEKTMS